MRFPRQKLSDCADASTHWLREFETKEGRSLRVLHIGNIANNAYINAKLMRGIGIEADVLCPDYYHIMGCPEWEDVDVSGDVGDENAPDWWGAGVLRGYRRPEWFVQGPRLACWALLAARSHRQMWRANALQKTLAAHRWLRSRPSPIVRLVVAKAPLLARAAFRSVRFCIFAARYLARRLLLGSAKKAAHSTFEEPAQEKLKMYASFASSPWWRSLLSYYDVIQAYATEGVFLLASNAPYIAYEHGTIRDIPFGSDTDGQLCAAVYRSASKVFITNADCVAAADRLGIPKDRQHPVPHGFDSHKASEFFEEWRPRETVRRRPPSFLAPARQHWKEGFATWRKGNDLVVRAARILADRKIDFDVTFVEWGKEIELTRELITALDVEEYFAWVKPMSKSDLWRSYLRSAGVIDQFVLKAVGSVTLEAMAMGRPVLTALDELVVAPFFGAMPPIHNVHDAEALADAMESIAVNPDEAEDLGLRAQDWISEYHSSERILEIHLGTYRDFLSEHSGTKNA